MLNEVIEKIMKLNKNCSVEFDESIAERDKIRYENIKRTIKILKKFKKIDIIYMYLACVEAYGEDNE